MEKLKTVVVIGGVAGGASAAARLRRLNDDIEIVVLERSGYVSFANCGLPYHLSATIPDRSDLLLQSPESLRARFRLDVRVLNEVTDIDTENRMLTVRRLPYGEVYQQPYDALVLSPGAAPIVPPIPGAERGLVLRDVEDLDRLIAEIPSAREVVVVGGGFIGLEAAENLRHRGLHTTIIELGDQVLAPLDPEMANPLVSELTRHGVHVELGHSATELTAEAVILEDGREIPADIVLFAIGVRPDASLARESGVEVGPLGGIKVNDELRTSDPHIWAVGDAVEKDDLIGDGATLTPLANIANRQGRRAADSIMGIAKPILPAQATAIVKIFDQTAACTGWNEKRLRAQGRDYIAIHTHPTSHATYYPGAERLAIKLLVDRADGTIMGAQAVGRDSVDKRIDVLATAMRAGLKATDLIDLELAYAPPFGSAKDPINVLGYISENRLSGASPAADWSQVDELADAGWTILDVRTPVEFDDGAIPDAINIPLDDLRDHMSELEGQRVLVYCAVGQRAHVAASLLRENGIEVRNLDGGWLTYRDGVLLAQRQLVRD